MDDEPKTIATPADVRAIEAVPLAGRWDAPNLHALLTATARRQGDRPAISFQLKSGPRDKATTLDWTTFAEQATQAANLFRSLGVRKGETVALLAPNAPETAVAMVGAMTAGVVAPISPLLAPEQIAAILRESGARALATLAPFPKTDISARAAAAVRAAPACRTILEIDLSRHLAPPATWLAPLLAPRRVEAGEARRRDWARALAEQRGDRLNFADAPGPDDVCAYFHTGGTTGRPKLVAHTHRGALYNAWLASRLLIDPADVVLCPLPLFHVLAAYPIFAACLASGAHFVMPTPAGYRGDGVIAHFWKLVARWRASFIGMAPTAAAALMQQPIDADVSSLKYALCGSAPMPKELFRRFETATGVRILEGYGQTETTCLVSCNPPAGERRIGSVGLPVPYTEVRVVDFSGDAPRDCAAGEIGEICVRSPGATPGYLDPALNEALFVRPGDVRTGDLGRFDADGYLWITGRARDLIIRGGHNIDPGAIEDALAAHPDVALAGAVGQPDAYAGELPCAYVELRHGAAVSGAALKAFAAERVPDPPARPVHVEVVDALPRTPIGKIYKPALRAMATARVCRAALEAAGVAATVRAEEDAGRGVVAVVEAEPDADPDAIAQALDALPTPWRLDGEQSA